jgi:hypothetical protein
MEVIAMSDLETNKAIALRLVEVFNGRQLDRLEDMLHPKFRGRGISAVMPGGPEVGPGAGRTLYQMFLQAIPDARGQVVDVVAESSSAVPALAITSSGRPSISTPFVTAKSSKTPS